MERNTIRFIYFLFAGLFIIIFLRIGYLQIFRREFFYSLAQGQQFRLVPLEGRRGRVLDCQGRTLAAGLSCYSIFADPKIIKNKPDAARKLTGYLGISEDMILRKIDKTGRFVWLKRKISWLQKEKIRSLKIQGIGFLRECKRFYPQETLGAPMLGIVDIDNIGLDGIELFYDRYLRGKDGLARVLQDSTAREIILTPQLLDPQDGADIVTTIDAQIQYLTERALDEFVIKNGASAGYVVVMNADTGEILALGNYPGFNPNKIGNTSPEHMKNRAICDMFEPGSVFKAVTLLGLCEKGLFNDSEIIDTENGIWKIPGATLHDWHKYEKLTMREVFKKSSNIGVSKLTQRLGCDGFYGYVKKLKFGEKTGIDLPGEVAGCVKPVNRWSKTTPYIMPIGQEIGVNILQLTRAYAVFANGGYLVQPHLVKGIYSREYIRTFKNEKIKIVDSAVALKARDVLIDVVADGTGKLAQVEGVLIGGKTGTAQKFDPILKRYSTTDYRASFIGFVADSNPPLAIGVSVDNPRKSHFGGMVAAPLFADVVKGIVKYLRHIKELESNKEKAAPYYLSFTPETKQ